MEIRIIERILWPRVSIVEVLYKDSYFLPPPLFLFFAMPPVRSRETFICDPGCSKTFRSEKGLTSHRTQSARCDKLFRMRVDNEIRAERRQNRSQFPVSDNDEDAPPSDVEVLAEVPIHEGPEEAEAYQQAFNGDDIGIGNDYNDIPDHLIPQQSESSPPSFRQSESRSPSPIQPNDPDPREEILINESHTHAIPSTDIRVEFPIHAGAGTVVGKQRSQFQAIQEELRESAGDNIYYPFASEMDWELTAFLQEAGMAMAQIDRFLKLLYVCWH
jgi:hypothetical protein